MAAFYREVALSGPVVRDHQARASARLPRAQVMPHVESDSASGGPVSPVASAQDVGEMLRRACVRTREMWDHPFFWGAFCLYG
jgi:hypothetical protein